MADPLSLVASVIAIIQITEQIVKVCRFYIESVQDAPSELRIIVDEISALKTVLANVKLLAECPDKKPRALDSLSGIEGPVEGCRKSIVKLEGLFPREYDERSGLGPQTRRKKAKLAYAELAWPFNKGKKVRKLLDEICLHKSTITLCLAAENTYDIKSINGQISDVSQKLTENQRQELFKWLNHTDPSPLHNEARMKFEPETGDWILDLPEWIDWLELRHRCLWIHGIPGAGKTVLISHLIEQIQRMCKGTPSQNRLCAYYYCHRNRQDETRPFLLWILHRLCRKTDLVSEDVYRMSNEGVQPDLNELMNSIAQLLNGFERVFIILDAIDESQFRENLLKILRDFIMEPRFKKIQLLASSREYQDIEQTMQTFSTPISMAHPSVEHNIKICIHSKLKSNQHVRHWPSDILAEVEDAISKGARGMFRWAVCQIPDIERLKGERRIIRAALRNLPKDLYQTYDRITLDIREDERIFVQHALYWIYYIESYDDMDGIPCEILLQAIAKSTERQGKDLSSRYYDAEVVKGLCGCLVTITPPAEIGPSNGCQTKSARVSLAHFTVHEYLDAFRIEMNADPCSAKNKQEFWRNLTTIVFSEACQVERNEHLEAASVAEGTDGDVEISEFEENDFRALSLILTTLSLQYEWHRIPEQKSMIFVAYDALDPYKQNWETVKTIISHCLGFSDFWPRVQESSWDEENGCSDAGIFVNLLLLVGEPSAQAWHVNNFLKHLDAKRLLHSHFDCVKLEIFDDGYHQFNYTGSILEVLMMSNGITTPAVDILLDYDQGSSDQSLLLYYYLGRHDDCDIGPVRRLLENGADPNFSKYGVTLLQLATVNRNTEAIEVLLHRGTRPNDVGNPNGIFGGEEYYHGRFDYLHGTSPLHILRHFPSTQPHSYGEICTDYDVAAEGALLRHGARDFRRNRGKFRSFKAHIGVAKYLNLGISLD